MLVSDEIGALGTEMSAAENPLGRDVLEHYEVSSTIIGKGAFGTVMKGVRKSCNTPVAVKVIKLVYQGQPQLASIRGEVDCLRCLNHPNIVKLHDFFETPTLLHICMEVVMGGELFDRITQKKHYSEKDARDLVLILISAVKHCHENCIVHRDIKAENLLMVSDDDDAHVKLVDFGFAAKAEGNSLEGVMGTPEYMAPEIWGNKLKYGAPVDMWAVGVLSYIILVGYPPFHDNAPLRLKTKIIRGVYEFHPEFWDVISVEGKDFVSRLLTVDMGVRMTAEQALQHPWWIEYTDAIPNFIIIRWLEMCAKELGNRKLEDSITQMKRFNAKRRLKASCNAVLAVGKMSRLLSIFKSKSGSQSFNPVSSSYRDDDVQDGIALDGPVTPGEPLISPRFPLPPATPTAEGEISPHSSFMRRKSIEAHCPQAHGMVLLDPLITDEELNNAMKKRIAELEQENREILLSLPQSLTPRSQDIKETEVNVREKRNEKEGIEEKMEKATIIGKKDNEGNEGKLKRADSPYLARVQDEDEGSGVDTNSRDTGSSSTHDHELDRLKLEKNLLIIRSLQLNLLDQ